MGQGSPVRRIQGFQAQFSQEFPFWELDIRAIKTWLFAEFCHGKGRKASWGDSRHIWQLVSPPASLAAGRPAGVCWALEHQEEVGRRGGGWNICSDTTEWYHTSGPASPVGPRSPGSPPGPGSPWGKNKEGSNISSARLAMQPLVFGAPPDLLVRHSPAKCGHQPGDTGQAGVGSAIPSTSARGVGGGC